MRTPYWWASSATTFIDSLNRAFWSFSLNVLGPKFFRVFEPAHDSGGSRFKHTIEPRISYGFDEEFDRTDDVLDYDEIDKIRGAGTRATYAVVQRLFAKRPQSAPAPPPIAMATIISA